jgi:ATP-dependent DNA helicase RecG
VLDTPVEYLKGIGPQRAEVLNKEIAVYTYRDLLQHYPFRYVDRTVFHKVNEIGSEMLQKWKLQERTGQNV